MREINTKAEYEQANRELERLIELVGNNYDFSSPEFIKMDRLSDLIAEYEMEHRPERKPNLIDAIKQRMSEKGLDHQQLAEKLGVPRKRVNAYLKGKRDITLEVAKKLKNQLDIDPDIILQ